MEVQFAVAKIGKYAAGESGDTLEIIERPRGGLSTVLVDGQRSGRAAKTISNMVARKAIQLLSEGVRDGAAARAAHDYLYTFRGGKVSATLNILSADTITKTFVISRNNDVPVMVHTAEKGFFLLDQPSQRVGIHPNTKPVIAEIPIECWTVIVVYTDGLRHAGNYSGDNCYNPYLAFKRLLTDGIYSPRRIADTLLQEAFELDNGRPKDDISVLVASVVPKQNDEVRRLDVHLPI